MSESHKPDDKAIEIPAENIEVIHVAPEDVHVEGETPRSKNQSGFHFKTYTFGNTGQQGPVVISLWKPLLGCLIFALLLFAGFITGIVTLLKWIWSFLN